MKLEVSGIKLFYPGLACVILILSIPRRAKQHPYNIMHLTAFFFVIDFFNRGPRTPSPRPCTQTTLHMHATRARFRPLT